MVLHDETSGDDIENDSEDDVNMYAAEVRAEMNFDMQRR
jgi:hypothetical protein